MVRLDKQNVITYWEKNGIVWDRGKSWGTSVEEVLAGGLLYTLQTCITGRC